MSVPTIRINPRVKAGAAREAYMRHGFVQIPDIFESEVAEHIAALMEDVTYRLAFQGENGKPAVIDPAQVDPATVEARLRDHQDRAGRGYGFKYQTYQLITAYLEQRDPGHPIHRLTEFLNAEFVAFGSYVTNQPQVAKADGQLTRYGPGDFIGLHDDVGTEDSDRLTAYTLGFTRRWRSDWGGQLLFHDDRGDVSRGFIPRFNTLTLFRVPQLHSVAPVAPYAQTPRQSVVGWLRNRGSR